MARDDQASACRHAEMRVLLVPYALSRCSEEEAEAFEAHLLACEPCIQDLRCLDRAGVLIREFTSSASPVRDRLLHVLGG